MISMKKYVDIKSAINTTRTATEKDLIARIFSNDSRLQAGQNYEFENSADVGEFFGTDSFEYRIAQKYFGFINKYARSPKKISYYRDWREGINASLSSDKDTVLATLKAITAGSLKLSINGTDKTVSSLDFSSATDFDDVASTLQTAIRAVAEEDEDMYADATVEADDNGRFTITSGIKEFGDVHTTEDTSASEALELQDKVDGRPEGTTIDVFEESYQVSNNFATYFFTQGVGENVAELPEYVNANHPSEFMFVYNFLYTNKENTQNFIDGVKNVDGVSLELCTGDALENFVLPMAITATTDYNKENGTVNYMYTQDSNMTPVVDNDDFAKELDEFKINYYGRTQQAGQKLAFYQNGVLQGKYQDQSIYVNEIWLKDALTTKYINYMMLTPNWYANKAGQAIGQGLAMDVIARAKLNGTITTEKELTEADKVYIYNLTADENAWRQIYQEGYYLATNIEVKTINNQKVNVFNYVLIYSKGDSIKKVEGIDILI